MKNTNLISAIALSFLSLTILAKTMETNQIEVVINQASPSNVFAANVGGSITDNVMTALPAGTTAIQNGFIYPKGTINLNQQSFTVDKNGNPLTQLNSIGTWQQSNFQLVDSSTSNPPVPGTDTALTLNTFSFNPNNNPNNPNQVVTMGLQEVVNTPSAGVQTSVIPMIVLGGFGKNQSANGTAVAKIYEAPDGLSMLMVITFNKKITINASH
jgi:hypothetical protein